MRGSQGLVGTFIGRERHGERRSSRPAPLPHPALASLLQMKTGPFAEHSNQLWNISAVPSWSKVNQGLIRMYKAEVSAPGRGGCLASRLSPSTSLQVSSSLLLLGWGSCCSRCSPVLDVPWEPLAVQVLLVRRKLLPTSCLPPDQSQNGLSLQA